MYILGVETRFQNNNTMCSTHVFEKNNEIYFRFRCIYRYRVVSKISFAKIKYFYSDFL